MPTASAAEPCSEKGGRERNDGSSQAMQWRRWRRTLSAKPLLLFLYPLCVFAGLAALLHRYFGCAPEKVKENKPQERAHLAVLILSTPSDVARRALLRSTYLSSLPLDVRVFFSVGISGLGRAAYHDLLVEHEASRDLLLLDDVKEDYGGLSGKVLSSICAIASRVSVSYLLKLDSDSFARLDDDFFDALRDVAHPRLYWGFLDGRAKPKTRGKWEESGWRLSDHFLPYALGGGYVLGKDLVAFVAANADRLTLFANEDVSVGAWLAGLKVEYRHDPRFDTEYASRGCDNRYIITHKQSADDIRQKWDHLQRHGKLCSREFRVRKSYIYNWDVPPSQCCQRTDDPQVP